MVTHTRVLKDKAIFLSTQARDNAPHYQHSEIGYNYRMSNICAGIGRGQMEVLDKYVNFRRANHRFYSELFSKIKDVEILTEPNSDFYSNHWLSVILLQSYEQREALRLAFENKNIETRPLWKPMHLQPVFKDAPYYGKMVSENLFEKGLCLPSGSNLKDEELSRIEKVIKDFFKL
jgi:dTDP-4-amino-4,6-dideoxygalactose transaminase